MFVFERLRKIRQRGTEQEKNMPAGSREHGFDETTDVLAFINLDLGKRGKGHQTEKEMQ